jgi:hypothetical protein
MDWVSFYSTLIGAGVSLVTSLIVFGVTFWLENKRVRKQQILNELRSKNIMADSVQLKFARILCWYRAVLREINPNNEKQHDSDGDLIYTIEAPILHVDQFTIEELSLVVDSNDIDLVGKILAVHANYLTTNELLARYERKIQSIDGFSDSSALDTTHYSDRMQNIVTNMNRSFHLGGLREGVIKLRESMRDSCVSGENDVLEASRRFHSSISSISGLKPKIRLS